MPTILHIDTDPPGVDTPGRLCLTPAFTAVLTALAIWPVWPWLARRLVDGSDEPWGVLPLLLLAGAALAGLRASARDFATPGRDPAAAQIGHGHSPPPSVPIAESAKACAATAEWVATGLLLLAYIGIYRAAPPLLRGVVGLSALALPLSRLLRRRPFDLAVWGLLMLGLPTLASLQFFVGYPLRVVVAQLAALQLRLGGTNVQAAGTILHWGERFVEVDAPCSGVRALWSGALLVCLLAYGLHLSNRRTAWLAVGAVPIILLGNSLRAAALFHLEIGNWPGLPNWLHTGVGVTVFAGLAIAIGSLAVWLEHRNANVPGGPEAENAPAGLVPVERKMELWTALPPKPPSPALPPWRQGAGDRVSAGRKIPSALPPAPGQWRRKPFWTASGWSPARRWLLGGWLAICLVAGGLPLATPPPRPAPTGQPPPWPVEFEGAALTPTRQNLPTLAGFPGQMAQYTDGRRQFLFKQVERPTRQLHPAADCFRGAGYRIEPGKLQVDRDGRHWATFTATRQQQALKVREIVLDGNGNSWSTLSAWYWSAIRQRTSAPWLAIVVVEAEADLLTRRNYHSGQ